MRQHVTPADPAAQIPDPIHGGYLSATGIDVEMLPYWLALAARGDVIVTAATDPGNGGTPPVQPAVNPIDKIAILRDGTGNSFTAADLLAFIGADNLAALVSKSGARANLGLGSVNNTADADKPVSTAQAAADQAVQSAAAGDATTKANAARSAAIAAAASDATTKANAAQSAAISAAASDAAGRIAALLNGADATHDTLGEIQALLLADEGALAGALTAIGNRLRLDADGAYSDAYKAQGRANLGAASVEDAYFLALFASEAAQ